MPKSKDQRTPAQRAVDAWGSPAELSADLRIDTATVRQWIARGGLIPAKYQSTMIAIARRKHIDFSAVDLLDRRAHE